MFQVSDGLFEFLKSSGKVCAVAAANMNQTVTTVDPSMQVMETINSTEVMDDEDCTEEVFFKYTSLQYSLFTNCGVEIIGGILFFITAIYIVRDKLACENASAGN